LKSAATSQRVKYILSFLPIGGLAQLFELAAVELVAGAARPSAQDDLLARLGLDQRLLNQCAQTAKRIQAVLLLGSVAFGLDDQDALFGNLAGKATVMKYFSVLPPASFSITSPSNAASEVNPSLTLSWEASDGAASYDYCYDTILNPVCDTSWISAGIKTSVSLAGLKAKTTYYWQVRAVNTGGTTYSTWGSFSTGYYKVFLPGLKH